jgi:hypothetical protein
LNNWALPNLIDDALAVIGRCPILIDDALAVIGRCPILIDDVIGRCPILIDDALAGLLDAWIDEKSDFELISVSLSKIDNLPQIGKVLSKSS